jgi:hypothetical protein
MSYNSAAGQPERGENCVTMLRLDWPAGMASFSLYNEKGRALPPRQPDGDEQRIEQRLLTVHYCLIIVS